MLICCREKVYIPSDKPFIFLKGAGSKNTFISWNGHGAINESAAFTSKADNIVAEDISFIVISSRRMCSSCFQLNYWVIIWHVQNTYNFPPKDNKNGMATAVAAQIQGDKVIFYRCGFFGLQDTLWDVQGRHYYKSCTIAGAVDFIFGAAQSLFEVIH